MSGANFELWRSHFEHLAARSVRFHVSAMAPKRAVRQPRVKRAADENGGEVETKKIRKEDSGIQEMHPNAPEGAERASCRPQLGLFAFETGCSTSPTHSIH